MTTTGTSVPTNVGLLQPYLAVRGAARAIAWYTDVFGAEEVGERFTDVDGRIGHAEVRIGESVVMLSDEYPDFDANSPETLRGTSVALHLYVADVDAVAARAGRAGAQIDRPPEDQPYGDRSCTFHDPFGHRWTVATRIEDLSLDELQRRNAETGFSVTAASRAGQLFYFTMAVRDGARANRFFTQLLGWQTHASGQPDSYHIESLVQPGGLHGQSEPGVDLYFVVDDIDEAVARVRELGGTADEPERYASGASARCTDDQGTPFFLSVPAPGY